MRDWLKRCREKACLEQMEVAKAVGITYSHYNFIENGKRRPSPQTAKKIAEVLGFDWTRFYEDTDKTA